MRFNNINGDIAHDNKELEELQNNQLALTKKLETGMPQEEIDEAECLKKFNESIRDAFSISINSYYEQRKPKLEKHISEIFLKLINNPKLYLGLEISDQWEIFVRYYDWKITSFSPCMVQVRRCSPNRCNCIYCRLE